MRSTSQRILRPRVLQRLGVNVDEARLRSVDQRIAYNSYVQVLEDLRQQLGIGDEEFYRTLLARPLGDRAGYVHDLGTQHFGDSELNDWQMRFRAADRVLRLPP